MSSRRSRTYRSPRNTGAVEPPPRPAQVVGRFQRFGVPLSMVVLCALVLAAYGNSFKNGFAWDDNQQIVMNPDLRPGAPTAHLFSGDVWNFREHIGGGHNYYRPLQMLTYRLTAQIWGFDPHAFHAVSIGFHLVVVQLAFFIFRRLGGRIDLAFASAALFAVHPVHAEAVDWISALPDIGCTVFLLLAFLFFHAAHFDEADTSARVRSHGARIVLVVLSGGALAAAMLWKETAVVFPLLVMAYVFCFEESPILIARLRSAVKLSVPSWCIVGGYLLLRFRVLGSLANRQRDWILSPFQFVLSDLNLLFQYWAKLIAPVHLNAYYVFSPVRSLADARAVISVLGLLFALPMLTWGLRRAALPTFAALWVFITLIPVFEIYALGRNAFTERYLYLPSVGFCVLAVFAAAWIGRWVPSRYRAASGVVVLLLVVTRFAEATISRNPDWRDDSTLFVRTLEASPNAPFVQNMVAELHRGEDSSTGAAEAESHYLQALSLAEQEMPPDRLQIASACEGMALIYADHADFDRAIQMLDKARMADADDPKTDVEQAMILTRAGRWTEANVAAQKALSRLPSDENLLNVLGIIAWHHDRKFKEAEDYFRRALEVHLADDDFSASVRSNLGGVYGEQGRLSDAIAQFKLAVAISPNDPAYHTDLAQGYAYDGQNELARAEVETALSLSPDYAPARAVLEQLPRR
jgi:protein O-mannosyl-transferase